MQQPGTAWIFCDCKIVCLASNGSEFFLCFSSRWIFQIHISKNCLQSSRMQSGLLSWLNAVFGRNALKNSITSGITIKRFWQWPFKSPFWKKIHIWHKISSYSFTQDNSRAWSFSFAVNSSFWKMEMRTSQ